MPTDPSEFPVAHFRLRKAGLEKDVMSRGENPNLVAQRDLSRYYGLLKASEPKLSEKEFNLLCDVCNGTLFEPIYPGMLHAEAEDAEPEYFTKWKVDREELLDKLSTLTVAQEIALIDRIERFWQAKQ